MKRSCICCMTWFCIIFDVVCDWAQYIEVTAAEEYKKAGEGVWWALLAFCLYGTMTFMVEIEVMCVARKWLRYLDLLTVWTEDIPQIILTAILAYHQPAVGSLFQIIKAVATIVEAVIKGITGCCRKCRDDSDNDDDYDEDSCCNKAIKCMTIAGYAATVLGAFITVVFIILNFV